MITTDGRVVVVGGGVAGLSAAVELRRLGHRGPLVLLDRLDALHDRPPLSKAFLRDEVEVEDLSPYPHELLRDQGVDVRTGSAAVRLDPGDDQVPAAVTLADGTVLTADAVVLAEGGRAARPPVPGVELALALRTLDDARALRPHLLPGRRLVVLGAGLVGAEVAATAVGLGVEVTLVDPDPLPVAGAVGADVARVLAADHVRYGVRLVTAAAVRLSDGAPAGTAAASGEDASEGTAASEGTVASEGTAAAGAEDGLADERDDRRPVLVELSDGSALEADVVLVATGMRPVDDLATGAGLEVAPGGGTLVDGAQRTSAPRVLAVGDGTCRRRPDGGPGAPAGHWDAARLDGLAAAVVLLGQEPPARGAPWFWSDRHGRHVEVVGTVAVVEEPGSRTVVRGEPGPGPFAVLAWRDGVLAGAVAVDDALTARAARRLVDRGVRVDPDALADPATDLRRLVRG
ncbi:NAD(P)/FAD-dependent oxidoreductase [Aquipuribacter hungaricus]|uniref:NAD(P)/FAD-dependent oxidoreductase n=1 Tax=Aquipuribacter hungaricus TaxID=545624 RepID=A0ABV7WM56_9MICO